MATTHIMLVRHAEKAGGNGTSIGVTVSGAEDARELSVRGWQRSGALIALFGPGAVRFPERGLATPCVIFAARPTAMSIRSVRTVEPLASSLSLEIDSKHGDGDEAKLIQKALACDGPVLIAWKHDGLPALAANLRPTEEPAPLRWPEDRFDLVWVFRRAASSHPWWFHQVPQLLLPGDRPDAIV